MKIVKAVSLSMVCALCLSSFSAHAVTTELSLDLVSAYVDRGATANQYPSLQGCVTVSEFLGEDFPLSLSVWADWALKSSKKTYERNEYYYVDRHQFGEVDLNADYELPAIPGLEDFSWAVGYGAYFYPDSDADTDHEVYLILSYDTFLQPTVGLYYLFAGGEYAEKAWYLECGVSHEFDIGDKLEMRDGLTFTVGADVGIQWWNSKMKEDWAEYDEVTDELIDSGIGYRSGFAFTKYYVKGDWSISALDDLGVSASLGYYQRLRKETLGNLFKNKWVGTVGISKAF